MYKKLLKNSLVFACFFVVLWAGFLVGKFFIINKPYFDTFSLAAIRGLPSVYTVMSGSMEPSIKTGGLVFSIPLKNYKKGDVITFKEDDKGKTLVTHRIVAQYSVPNKNELIFYTKGDANKTMDTKTVQPQAIVGKAFFGLPYLGFLAHSAKNPKIFILLVIIPATIVVYEELKIIFLEARSVIGKNVKKFSKLASLEKSYKGLNKSLLLVPLLSVLILLSGVTGSFFTDHVESSGNVLAVSTSLPTPTPTATPNPGDKFLDQVLSVMGTFGHCCDAGSLSTDPNVAASYILGAPDSPPGTNFIQISQSGVVTGKFTNNKVVDGTGADIKVYIYDNLFPGSAKIEVAQGPDCASTVWHDAGNFEDTANIEIDIAPLGLSEASCIRFTDLGGPDTTYPTLGFDLDAVEALNSVAVP